MKKPVFQLIATDWHDNKHVVNTSEDSGYLWQILEAREGITWIGGECCSLEVVTVTL